MKLETKMLVMKARREAEKEIGAIIPDDIATEVLSYCERKLVCMKKGEDYLPILYRCELPLQVQMRELTELSAYLNGGKRRCAIFA